MAVARSRVRSTSRLVATKPGCAPLHAMYQQADAAHPRTWGEVEEPFLRAMEAFDTNVASGLADLGDLQNGKGDFLNDLVALLLEGCAGIRLFARSGVPGFVFPHHSLDVTYPNSGVVRFALEVKAVGTPRHPGSQKQRPIGRPGSADLAKRLKEVAFKTIDLKAEFGRIMAAQGHPASAPGGNLTTWLRSVPPKSYLFVGARVVSEADLRATIGFAHTAAQVVDGVGLFCFGPASENPPTTYRAFDVPPEISMDRVLYRACQDLTEMQRETMLPIDPAATGPAPQAQDALDALAPGPHDTDKRA